MLETVIGMYMYMYMCIVCFAFSFVSVWVLISTLRMLWNCYILYLNIYHMHAVLAVFTGSVMVPVVHWFMQFRDSLIIQLMQFTGPSSSYSSLVYAAQFTQFTRLLVVHNYINVLLTIPCTHWFIQFQGKCSSIVHVHVYCSFVYYIHTWPARPVDWFLQFIGPCSSVVLNFIQFTGSFSSVGHAVHCSSMVDIHFSPIHWFL